MEKSFHDSSAFLLDLDAGDESPTGEASGAGRLIPADSAFGEPTGIDTSVRFATATILTDAGLAGVGESPGDFVTTGLAVGELAVVCFARAPWLDTGALALGELTVACFVNTQGGFNVGRAPGEAFTTFIPVPNFGGDPDAELNAGMRFAPAGLLNDGGLAFGGLVAARPLEAFGDPFSWTWAAALTTF